MRLTTKNSAVACEAAHGGGTEVGEAPTQTALEAPTKRGTRITAWVRSSRAGGIAAAAAALALVTGCGADVNGNGVLAEEARDNLATFVGIHIDSGDIQRGEHLSAVVTSGEPQSVKVIGDANLVPDILTLVESEVVGTTTIPVLSVRVDVAGKYDPTIPPQVVITVPSFSFVHAEGSSLVQVNHAAASVFQVKASGTSGVSLAAPSGQVGDVVDATLRDEALLDATEYPSAGAIVDLAGQGTAKLHSDGPVTGTATGDSLLNNLLGTGSCEGVTLTQNAATVCNPP